jgi:hypothetical protein
MGQTAILLVMGLTTLMLLFGGQMNSVSTDAMDNSITYYESSQRYDIAETGANLACHQFFLDNTWRTGYTDMPFSDGKINVSLSDSASGKVKITAVGTYQGSSHTITVLLSPSNFLKFAMYSNNVSSAAKFRDGDTIAGSIHLNNKLFTQGAPVFKDKATMGSLKTASGTPKFLNGYETGVNIPFPDYTPYVALLKASATSGGYIKNGGELWLDFQANGKVRVKTSLAGTWSGDTVLSANGKICINDGALHVQGIVQGNYTVASTVTVGTTPSATKGSTFCEDNLRYATDPLTTPSSTDMIGIISAGDIMIQKLPIKINGSLYTNQNITLASGLNGSDPPKQIRMFGTFITREINSTDFGTGMAKGANFYMQYDDRVGPLQAEYFPFPKTGGFEILSWLE